MGIAKLIPKGPNLGGLVFPFNCGMAIYGGPLNCHSHQLHNKFPAFTMMEFKINKTHN